MGKFELYNLDGRTNFLANQKMQIARLVKTLAKFDQC